VCIPRRVPRRRGASGARSHQTSQSSAYRRRFLRRGPPGRGIVHPGTLLVIYLPHMSNVLSRPAGWVLRPRSR
jgi:hypothetical protein